ncbi:MAG: MMPL family transporter [Acidimicrobiia bacterium]
MQESRLHRMYNWVGSHIALVAVATLIAVMGLGVVGPMVANTDEPNFDPAGEVFDTLAYVDGTLQGQSSVETAVFLVEAPNGGANVLTREALLEWKTASDSVRADAANSPHLIDRFDRDSGATIPGVLSFADIVDASLPGGLASASDQQVAAATKAVLAEGSGFDDFKFTLSEKAALTAQGWTSPAFTTQVVFDVSTFDDNAAQELWLRDVQAQFREGAIHADSIGVAIDGDTTFEEAAMQSAPFIFLAVSLIILLVVFVHRSYWSGVVVGAGLGATTLVYYGVAALIGLKMGSLLLSFIVPIAMISFGVDFYIHGVGRVREMQVEGGMGVKKAYPFGMTAVFTAMLLAVLSSVAAFMANAASGTEAIIEFGIGAAIALSAAYILLGQIGPRITVGLETFVGDDPIKGASRYLYGLAALVMAVIGGLAVALGAVMPTAGTVALLVFIVLCIAVPSLVTRMRNRRAMSRGKDLVHGHVGSAHGLKPAGTVVHFLARWRMITIPVVIVVGLLGFSQALKVDSGFKIEDFLSADTDFAQSIDRVGVHFPSSGEGSSFIFIEGDLVDPANLVAIDHAVDSLNDSPAEFGRNTEGDILVSLHAADVVRMVMASPAAATIEANGPSLIDSDGDGIPDTRAAITAIYRNAKANGVLTPEGEVAISAEELPSIFVDEGDIQATAIVIQVGSFTDGAIIVPVRDALEAAAAGYESASVGTEAKVSGEVVAQYLSMESFTRSMLVSLPLALALTFLIASAMLRSVRFALVSVLPIGLVVIGLYAFMATFGYTVNVVTATIAAIAVGVGIDFSTHFTARYREEVAAGGGRLEAVRRSGTGTGGALVLSAVTSVLGFLVMAMAPAPIFATFGALTAVMIVLSLMVAILVLPSLLVLVTPKESAVEADVSHEREAALV